ncbi:MAG TPA: nitroreductase family protein [Caulobacteraceae bacterium]|nr:nitroreductase family protein [Caulobacteraceae bacterium]
MTVTANGRTADHDIEPVFLRRWSPRAFTGEAIPRASLMSLFEAARWAPSAFNLQPWRFVYAVRDTPDWERLLAVLVEYNQAWVRGASALVFMISDRFRRKPGAEPEPLYSHSFDAGAAWAYLALQAHHLGLAAHGMTGFDPDRAHEELGVPEAEDRIEAATAIGRPADKSVLPEPYRARETPSQRLPMAGFVFEGRVKA